MHEIKRDFFERRSGKDRRSLLTLRRFFYRGKERRGRLDRRSPAERRDGWVRVSKWSSACLLDLKIAKYLH